MAEHATFTVATDVDVYFCDPQSPWQRGSNDTNGFLRQYSSVSAREYKTRPRLLTDERLHQHRAGVAALGRGWRYTL